MSFAITPIEVDVESFRLFNDASSEVTCLLKLHFELMNQSVVPTLKLTEEYDEPPSYKQLAPKRMASCTHCYSMCVVAVLFISTCAIFCIDIKSGLQSDILRNNVKYCVVCNRLDAIRILLDFVRVPARHKYE